ncbi:MAG: hypothetical protein M3Q50_05825 [Chloroflexota bacterium]|nr:hypothetical protein [Chloroflexota bacterium]
MKLSRMLMGSALAVSFVGAGLMATPVAAQDDCVSIYGGDVLNETVIDLNANAGTAISDASGGSDNAAEVFSDGLDDFDIASSGNGGVATASANGGAIGVGDINSGGNVGNAIAVGDTHCADAVAPDHGKADNGKADNGKAADVVAAGAAVVALPDTGVGAGEVSGLFALLTSVGAAAASLGLRRR